MVTVPMTQARWDIVHGDDPLAIFEYDGKKRPTPNYVKMNAETGLEEEIDRSKKPLGKLVYEVHSSTKECPACGSYNFLVMSKALNCLGCNYTVRTHQEEMKIIVAHQKRQGPTQAHHPQPATAGGGK